LSSKSSYQDLSEEERQNIKDLLFILEKFNVSDSAKRELTVFCDGLPRTYLVSSMRPYDSTNQSAVSAFDLNSFIFLDLLFSIINASTSLCANEHIFIIKTH
jgi:hypothetical protein